MTQNLETVKEMIDNCDYVKTIIWQNTITKSKDKWQTGRNSFWPTSQRDEYLMYWGFLKTEVIKDQKANWKLGKRYEQIIHTCKIKIK